MNTEQTATDVYTLLYTGGLGRYLIMVGIRSLEYTYTDEQIFANVEYFDKCRKSSNTSISSGLQTCNLCGGAMIIPMHIIPTEYKIQG